MPVTMVEMHIDAGATVRQDLPATYNTFLYIIEGSARFGKELTPGRVASDPWERRFDRRVRQAQPPSGW